MWLHRWITLCCMFQPVEFSWKQLFIFLESAALPDRLAQPWRPADRAELLMLRKMFGWILALDLRPTTSRRSDKFILAVTSPLLSPVCNIILIYWLWFVKNKYMYCDILHTTTRGGCGLGVVTAFRQQRPNCKQSPLWQFPDVSQQSTWLADDSPGQCGHFLDSSMPFLRRLWIRCRGKQAEQA